MDKNERNGSGKAKPGASGNGLAGLQMYPESPRQQKEWEREVLESMVIPAVFDVLCKPFFPNFASDRPQSGGGDFFYA
jgi:hypothetical protein